MENLTHLLEFVADRWECQFYAGDIRATDNMID
jgi:hypothetical protein